MASSKQVADVLEQLLEFKWRDVSFPVSEFSTDMEHDHVAHKWPDRDGGHIEATGRAPIVHHATIHFRNNMSPGLSESWSVNNQALYPTVFRAFLVAFATRTSGPLQHPELGIVNCKPKTAQFKWTSARRDGIDCNATWVESDDTTADFQDVLARNSPVPEAYVAAADLDVQLGQYKNPTVTYDGDPSSFLSAIQKITSAFDTASLMSAQYAGRIDRVVYRVQSLQTRVNLSLDLSAWPLVNSCERLKSALFGLKTELLKLGKTIATVKAPKDTTLAALTILTGTPIDRLLQLNPLLASRPGVTQGTVVRYYLKT